MLLALLALEVGLLEGWEVLLALLALEVGLLEVGKCC